MRIISSSMERSMRKKAYAKITLSLYAYQDHGGLKFKNVIVPLDLFDMVYLEKSETMLVSTNKAYLPNDRRNTVYRMIDLIKSRFQIEDNFKVHIVKNIPAQSGLGGGSTNAATVLNMLNDMYGLNLSDNEKMEIASQIDEDTPYCVFNRPSLVEGIGEILTPIDLNVDLYYLLVKPSFGVSTKTFLRRFNDFDTHYDYISDAMAKACTAGSYGDIVANRYNSFQKKVVDNYPKMIAVIDRLESLGLDAVGMSGSGTCVVGFAKDQETVMKLYERVVFDYPFVKYGVIKGTTYDKMKEEASL